MADIVDNAQAREEMDRDIALRAVQERIAESFGKRDPNSDTLCIDCDEEIEPARLAAVPRTARCACCANAWEQRLRRQA
jgi:RNA polymerase-binding transcription factor DksA